jgi:hypothetical protein
MVLLPLSGVVGTNQISKLGAARVTVIALRLKLCLAVLLLSQRMRAAPSERS